MLNPSSRLKGEKDWRKYETARELAKKIEQIRENYTRDFKSTEKRVQQRAVAMYFIDKVAILQLSIPYVESTSFPTSDLISTASPQSGQ